MSVTARALQDGDFENISLADVNAPVGPHSSIYDTIIHGEWGDDEYENPSLRTATLANDKQRSSANGSSTITLKIQERQPLTRSTSQSVLNSLGSPKNYRSFSHESRYALYDNITSSPPIAYPSSGKLTPTRASDEKTLTLSSLSVPKQRKFSQSTGSLPIGYGSAIVPDSQSSSPVGSSSPIYRPSQDDSPLKLPVKRFSIRRQPSTLSLQQEDIDSINNSADDIEVSNDVIFWNVPITPSLPSSNSKSQETADDSYFPPQDVTSKDCPEISVKSPANESGQKLKTWGRVMNNLSEEVRDLTIALEEYRGLASIKGNTNDLPTANVETVTAKAITEDKQNKAINDTIEGSFTRPAHLPRKSKYEEDRHVREFKKMMRLSQEQEKKRRDKIQLKVREFRHVKEKNYYYITRYVMSHLPAKLTDPQLKKIIWASGIPEKCRERIWKSLLIDPYPVRLSRLDEILQLVTSEDLNNKDLCYEIESTYASTRLFQTGGPLHDAIVKVVAAFTKCNPKIKYTSGSSLIVGGLLLFLDEKSAFAGLMNIINNSPLSYFYENNERKLSRFACLFDKAFATHLPSLHHHFTVIHKISCQEYLNSLIPLLFSNHFHIDFMARLWDVIFIEMMNKPYKTPTALSRYGSSAISANSSVESLFIAIVLAILKVQNTKFLISDREEIIRSLVSDCNPINFESNEFRDMPEASIFNEIAFLEQVRNFFVSIA
ncbi:rab-GTPase-TBC domain-containing protein [Dipodascopsis uninucleata]